MRAIYSHEVILLGQTLVEDELGNQETVDTEKPILCKVDSVGRNEFYSAASSDLRPEVVLTIHKYEYEGERKVIFEGLRYSVIRTYATGIEEIELTCGRVGADVH